MSLSSCSDPQPFLRCFIDVATGMHMGIFTDSDSADPDELRRSGHSAGQEEITNDALAMAETPHLRVSLPEEWALAPAVVGRLDCDLNGTRWLALNTQGDGACALHALWGFPHASGSVVALRRDDVQNYVLRHLPRSWADAERFQQGKLRPFFAERVAGKWADLVDSTLCEDEKEVFERALPASVQDDAMLYQEEVHAWMREKEECLREFRIFAEEFVIPANEVALVRPLAYFSGYVSTCDVDFLCMDPADARASEWEGPEETSFGILQYCGEGRTKYQALFNPLEQEGSTDYRQRFFHTAQDDEGAARRDMFLDTFRNWVMASCERADHALELSSDQRLLVRRGLSILEFGFAQRRSPPAWPPTFTESVGWPALWHALHSSSYWLSADELQCLAACCSCRVHVYTQRGDGEPEERAILRNSENLNFLSHEAHVMLRLGAGLKRGHFVRLVQEETLKAVQDREYEQENMDIDEDKTSVSESACSSSSASESSCDSSSTRRHENRVTSAEVTHCDHGVSAAEEDLLRRPDYPAPEDGAEAHAPPQSDGALIANPLEQ